MSNYPESVDKIKNFVTLPKEDIEDLTGTGNYTISPIGFPNVNRSGDENPTLVIPQFKVTYTDSKLSANLRVEAVVSATNTPPKIKLDANPGISTADDYYSGYKIKIVNGTGIGQVRTITSYDASSQEALVDSAWTIVPTIGATYSIYFEFEENAETGIIRKGFSQGASSSTTITLDADASDEHDIYNDYTIKIVDGTGIGQNREITDYNGTTKEITIGSAWTDNPDLSSVFLIVVRQNTAQAGSTPTTIKLDTNASSTTGFYDSYEGTFRVVKIVDGTGQGQARIAVDNDPGPTYNGTTRVLTISPTWATTPDVTSVYVILEFHPYVYDDTENDNKEGSYPHLLGTSIEDIVVSSTNSPTPRITLSASSSAVNDYYNGMTLEIIRGEGFGQSRIVTDYNGTTKVALVDLAWIEDQEPDVTSTFRILFYEDYAQTGSYFSTIVLSTSASDVDDFYNGMFVEIVLGSGIGQRRKILDYVGATRIATIDSNWDIIPTTSNKFKIFKDLDHFRKNYTSSEVVNHLREKLYSTLKMGHGTGTLINWIMSPSPINLGSGGSKSVYIDPFGIFKHAPIARTHGTVNPYDDHSSNLRRNRLSMDRKYTRWNITNTFAENSDGDNKSPFLKDYPNVYNSDNVNGVYGTAVTATSTTITLNSLSKSVDDFYENALIEIIGGPGHELGTITSAYTVPATTYSSREDYIVLDPGASASDDYYVNWKITITSSTGVGQSRTITEYVGSTQTARLNEAWDIDPESTSTYILSEIKTITAYVASTKVATVNPAWNVNGNTIPTGSSTYKITTIIREAGHLPIEIAADDYRVTVNAASTPNLRPMTPDMLYYMRDNSYHNNITLDMSKDTMYGRHHISILHELFNTDTGVNNDIVTELDDLYTELTSADPHIIRRVPDTGLEAKDDNSDSTTDRNIVTYYYKKRGKYTITSLVASPTAPTAVQLQYTDTGANEVTIHLIPGTNDLDYVLSHSSTTAAQIRQDILENNELVPGVIDPSDSNVVLEELFVHNNTIDLTDPDSFYEQGKVRSKKTFIHLPTGDFRVILTGNFVGVPTDFRPRSAKIGVTNTASEVDGAYENLTIEIISGKGIGQIRKISDYSAVSKTVYINEKWNIIPDTTSVYRIIDGEYVKDGSILELDVSLPKEISTPSFLENTLGVLSGYKNYITQPRVYIFSGHRIGQNDNCNIDCGLTEKYNPYLFSPIPEIEYSTNGSDGYPADIFHQRSMDINDINGNKFIKKLIFTSDHPYYRDPANLTSIVFGATPTTIYISPSTPFYQSYSDNNIDDYYNGSTIEIIDGLGVGQVRTIIDYDSATRTATVDSSWTTTPNITSKARISDIGKIVTGSISGDLGTLVNFDQQNKVWIIKAFDANVTTNPAEVISILNGVGEGITFTLSSPLEQDKRSLLAVVYPTNTNTFGWRLDQTPTFKMMHWSILANSQYEDSAAYLAYKRNKSIVDQYSVFDVGLKTFPISYTNDFVTGTPFTQFISSHMRMFFPTDLIPQMDGPPISQEDINYTSFTYQGNKAFNELISDFYKGRIRLNHHEIMTEFDDFTRIGFSNSIETGIPTDYEYGFFNDTNTAIPNSAIIDGFQKWMTKPKDLPEYIVTDAIDYQNPFIGYDNESFRDYLEDYYIVSRSGTAQELVSFEADVATTGLVSVTLDQFLQGSAPIVVDGKSVTPGDRILVKDQDETPYENGIYTVVSDGIWTRATDYDNDPLPEVFGGGIVHVGDGQIHINSLWSLVTSNPVILGSSSLYYEQISHRIVLDSGASQESDFYKGMIILITGGTGVGQYRTITSHFGIIAVVDTSWDIIPDDTSTYSILLQRESDASKSYVPGTLYPTGAPSYEYGTGVDNILVNYLLNNFPESSDINSFRRKLWESSFDIPYFSDSENHPGFRRKFDFFEFNGEDPNSDDYFRVFYGMLWSSFSRIFSLNSVNPEENSIETIDQLSIIQTIGYEESENTLLETLKGNPVSERFYKLEYSGDAQKAALSKMVGIHDEFTELNSDTNAFIRNFITTYANGLTTRFYNSYRILLSGIDAIPDNLDIERTHGANVYQYFTNVVDTTDRAKSIDDDYAFEQASEVRVATTVNITLSGPQTIDIVSAIAGDKVLVKNQTLPEENGVYVVAAGAWTRVGDVYVATTASITLSGTQTIDTIGVIAGNRVLVKNQTISSENGIYVVAAGAWTRATDYDDDIEVSNGQSILVSSGALNGGYRWKLETEDPIIVGASALFFNQPDEKSYYANGKVTHVKEGTGVNLNSLWEMSISDPFVLDTDAITFTLLPEVLAEDFNYNWTFFDTGHGTRTNTAVSSGSGSDTIVLDAGASAEDDFYVGNLITITSGPGVGQKKVIVDYDGSTQEAVVDSNWTTPPGTGTFEIKTQLYNQITANGQQYQFRKAFYDSKGERAYIRVKMKFIFSEKLGRWVTLDYRQYPISYLTPTFGNAALSYKEKTVVLPGKPGDLVTDYVPIESGPGNEIPINLIQAEKRNIWQYTSTTGVKLVATTNITLSGTQSIDSIGAVTDDRILVTGQTLKSENGIYVVQTGAWIRSTDLDDSYDFKNPTYTKYIRVISGATKANTLLKLDLLNTIENPFVLGSSKVEFEEEEDTILEAFGDNENILVKKKLGSVVIGEYQANTIKVAQATHSVNLTEMWNPLTTYNTGDLVGNDEANGIIHAIVYEVQNGPVTGNALNINPKYNPTNFVEKNTIINYAPLWTSTRTNESGTYVTYNNSIYYASYSSMPGGNPPDTNANYTHVVNINETFKPAASSFDVDTPYAVGDLIEYENVLISLSTGSTGTGFFTNNNTVTLPWPYPADFEFSLPSTVDDFYNGMLIQITAIAVNFGTRKIIDYDAATRVITLDSPFSSDTTQYLFGSFRIFNPTVYETLVGETGLLGTGANVPIKYLSDSASQAGSTINTLVLIASASASDDFYNGMILEMTSGVSDGSFRTIIDYNGTTKVATIDSDWLDGIPSASDTFQIYKLEDVVGVGSVENTVKLSSFASASDDFYNGMFVQITSGTGVGQTRKILDYVGGTRIATVDTNWILNYITVDPKIPISGDTFRIINAVPFRMITPFAQDWNQNFISYKKDDYIFYNDGFYKALMDLPANPSVGHPSRLTPNINTYFTPIREFTLGDLGKSNQYSSYKFILNNNVTEDFGRNAFLVAKVNTIDTNEYPHNHVTNEPFRDYLWEQKRDNPLYTPYYKMKPLNINRFCLPFLSSSLPYDSTGKLVDNLDYWKDHDQNFTRRLPLNPQTFTDYSITYPYSGESAIASVYDVEETTGLYDAAGTWFGTQSHGIVFRDRGTGEYINIPNYSTLVAQPDVINGSGVMDSDILGNIYFSSGRIVKYTDSATPSNGGGTSFDVFDSGSAQLTANGIFIDKENDVAYVWGGSGGFAQGGFAVSLPSTPFSTANPSTLFWSQFLLYKNVTDLHKELDFNGDVLSSPTTTTIELDSDASDVDDFYNGRVIEITSGVGSGQIKTILDYIGSTRIATVDSVWATPPDSTSTVNIKGMVWVVVHQDGPIIYKFNGNDIIGTETIITVDFKGTAVSDTPDTIGLPANASPVDDFYVGKDILITGFTGVGQRKKIVDYDGSTKIVTVDYSWGTSLDTTSTFEIHGDIIYNSASNGNSSVRVAPNGDVFVAGQSTYYPPSKAISRRDHITGTWIVHQLQTPQDTVDNGLTGILTSAIRIDSYGDVFIGTTKGLWRFISDGQYEKFYNTNSANKLVFPLALYESIESGIGSMNIDSNDNIWVTGFVGVLHFNRYENNLVFSEVILNRLQEPHKESPDGINFVVPNNVHGGSIDPNPDLFLFQPHMFRVYWNIRPAVSAYLGTDIPSPEARTGGDISDPCLANMFDFPNLMDKYSIPWDKDMSKNWLFNGEAIDALDEMAAAPDEIIDEDLAPITDITDEEP